MADHEQRIEAVALVASKPVWGLLGITMTALVGAFSWWLTVVQGQTNQTRAEVSAVQATAYAANARLSAIEARLAAVDLSFVDIKAGQRETNAKLDRLLERPVAVPVTPLPTTGRP